MTQRVGGVLGALALSTALWIAATASAPGARAADGARTSWFEMTTRGAAADFGGVPQLERTARRLAQAPANYRATLAARVSQEGHWTFINAAGETFTAASDVEVKRGLEILLPALGEGRPTVILTGDSIFERPAFLAQLPKGATLALGWGDETIKLTTTGANAGVRYLAELMPNLLIELTNAAAFDEAIRQLRRPLDRQAFRVLKLEPAGPRMFAATPRIDKATGRAEVDAIDPTYLLAALRGLRGQTAVLVGRVDGDNLVVAPDTGPQRTLLAVDLMAAAAAADVDVLVLKSSGAQQPGGRNWLWLRIDVKGLETALGHATLADFFNALGSTSNRLVLSAARPTPTRTTLDLRQASGVASTATTTEKISSVLADAVAGLAGNVVHQGAVANFRSADRQVELERRLVPFIPSLVQWLYGGLLALGLLGAPLAWRWWQQLWPAEQASDYPNRIGFAAARGVRGSIFAVLFMPAVALAAAPLQLCRSVGRWIWPAQTPGTKP